MVLQTENTHKKKSCWKYTDGNIPSVIVAYEVNIFQLSVNCRMTVSVGINIGEYDMCSKYFDDMIIVVVVVVIKIIIIF
jgi:hypothetical protein